MGSGCYLHGRDKVEKTEEIKIKMTLDKKAYARHAHAVTTLVPPQKMDESDDLKVNYTFRAGYFGGIVDALEAVKKICSDPDVVVSASCASLTQGRILVYEALKRLDAVIAEIEKR